MDIIKVSSRSSPKLVAGAIAAAIRKCSAAEIQAVGAGAVNQAVKSIAVARTYLDCEIVCMPEFKEVEIDGESKTVISFSVETK